MSAEPGRVLDSWEQAFTEEYEIDLEVPQAGPKLLQVGRLEVRSDGKLIIPDSRARRILVFEPDGTLVRQVEGGEDGGFAVSILSTAALDGDENLLVFDPEGAWVTVLEAPDYHPIRRFQLPALVAHIVALSDGSFLAYAPTEKKVFQRFDQTGRRLAATHRIRDERLRLFHSRVQTGGIALTSGGEIVGIHPAAFELIRMSPNLKVKEIVRAPEGDRWQPSPRALPQDLSPYDYTPAHEDWWDTFDHVGAIHGLSNNLLLVSIFSSRGLGAWNESVNIYHLGDRVRSLAGGLQVPHGARVVGTHGDHVFLVRNARLGDGESLEPLALYRYRVDLKFP